VQNLSSFVTEAMKLQIARLVSANRWDLAARSWSFVA
jgi:hypothetical protein